MDLVFFSGVQIISKMNIKYYVAVFILFNAFNATSCDINFLLGLYKELNTIFLKFKNISYDIFRPEMIFQMMTPSQWDTPAAKGK